jgi:hypothetical protein
MAATTATANVRAGATNAAKATGQVFRLHPKQGVAYTSIATEILYGGSAGSGKSHLMRVAAITWCLSIPGLQIYLFRRTFPDLFKNHMEGEGSFPVLLGDMVKRKECRIIFGNEPKVIFPNGSKIHLCHCQHAKDIYKYQGAEIHVLMVDELTHWLAPMYYFLRGRVRLGGLKIPDQFKGRFPRILCGANPGGIGHSWVKLDFIDNAPPLRIKRMSKTNGGMLRQYIPARMEDNPTLMDNDPTYRDRLQGLGDPALVRAMLEGDWDIVSGGMFDDLWKRSIHVVRPFKIPPSWRIDRSFDWGSSRPFSVGWWAESDGTDILYPDGTRLSTRRGDLFRIGEWYGWNGKANEGLKMLASDVAKQIIEREKAMGIDKRVVPGPADTSIFDEQNGNCIARDMESKGVRWTKADKSAGSRKQGWEAIRKRLSVSLRPLHERDDAGLWVFETCRHFIRTVPVIPRDSNDPDDVDTDAEDHCFVADTLVDTEHGPIRIADLVGTEGRVFSRDGGLHEYQSCRLTKRGADVVRVTFEGGRVVVCTPDHRFLSVDGRWIEAHNLLGESILVMLLQAWFLRVVSVEPAGKADVYCLTVPTTEAFCIEGGIVVHNCADEVRYRIYAKKHFTGTARMTGFK